MDRAIRSPISSRVKLRKWQRESLCGSCGLCGLCTRRRGDCVSTTVCSAKQVFVYTAGCAFEDSYARRDDHHRGF